MSNIYISTYGFPCIKVEKGIPIEVGCYNREKFLYELHDDNGDNISCENPYYGELTGLYYIWKNIIDKDKKELVGFCHYNKALDIKLKEVEKLIPDKCEWIVAKKTHIPAHANQEEQKIFIKLLQTDYPKYYSAYCELYHEDGSGELCNVANMFISTEEEMDKYCCFLFEFLEKLRQKIGEKDTSKYKKRYCAFLSERLLSVWLLANQKAIYEVDIRYKTSKIPYGVKELANIIIKKDGRLYNFIRKRLGLISSYK